MNMKIYKTLAVAAVALGCSGAADAQVVVNERSVSVTEFTCDPTTKYTSNWRDNWFIQLGAGINQPFVEMGHGGVEGPGPMVNRKKMTAVYNFGFGHWFSPYLAFRVNALGGALHWDTPTKDAPKNGWTRGKHANLNVDLMWDMFNSICGPDENRVFSIIPYVGIGGDCMWDIRDSEGKVAAATNIYRTNQVQKRKMSWTLPVSAGIQFRVRLCAWADFFAELRSNFYGDNWNLNATGDPIEANVSCYGGLSFNVGPRNFGRFNECDYLSQIAQLNNQVNNLRAEVLAGAQAIAALEAQLPCPEVEQPQVVNQTIVINENSPLLATVRFTINSDVISPEEMVNVYNMAEWMKANPDKNVVINGYADKDTGTADYNLALSKKRAEKVYDVMTNYYGINPDRLTVKYEGSNIQPYDVNNWNRIVVFTLQ